MSNELFEHNFHVDQEENQNSYPITDVQWNYINDINQGNYSTGFINWTNVAVIGTSIDKQYDWSQAYTALPIQTSVIPDGNKLLIDSSKSNINALGLKGAQHIVDYLTIKFNGVNCNRGSYYNNFYVHEQIKKMSTDEFKIYGDILNMEWDDGRSMQYIDNVGEVNNVTAAATINDIVNQGHVNRLKKGNIDLSAVSRSPLGMLTGLTAANLVSTEHQTGLCYCKDDGLVFRSVIYIPLSKLHDFFAQMPTVASSNGFELRLQCNATQENSYTVTYGALSNGTYPITALTQNQVVGHTCPWLLSNNKTDGSAGLVLKNGASPGADGTVTICSRIGWGTATGNYRVPTGFTDNTMAPPARIWIPAINFTPEYTKQIISKPQHTLRYDDFYVDFDLNKPLATQVSRLFNVQLSRVRKLYILPFLTGSSANTSLKSPYISPLSSAPNTTTPCRLKNFNIQIGGQNIFVEPQTTNNQFYHNNYLSLVSKVNGNSSKSQLFGTQITKSMWEQGYTSYVINLEKVADEVTDSLMKSFQFTFQIDGDSKTSLAGTSMAYDFLYLITYQSILELDRATGEIISNN